MKQKILALVPEVEEARHLPTLVVAPQHPYLLGEADLQTEDQRQHLDGVRPSVDVIAFK